MNHIQLKQELSKFPDYHDKVAHVQQSAGWPEEKAADLVNFLMQRPAAVKAREKKPEALFTQSEFFQKLASRIQVGDVPATEPKVDKLSAFELDRRHNRYLLGCDQDTCSGLDLEDASFDNPSFIKRQLYRDLRAAYGMAKAKPLLLLCGGTGEGKTLIALAWANKTATVHRDFLGRIQSTNVKFITAYDLTMLISGKKLSDLDGYKKAGILILDDVGGEPTGYKGADFSAELNEIITYRDMYRKPTIITTNHMDKQVGETPGFFEVYGERIRSRFAKTGVVITAAEGDMRRMA